MELKPRAEQKIRALIDKGVSIPNPLTLDIGDEVNIDTISGTMSCCIRARVCMARRP